MSSDILADDWELEEEWYKRINHGILCWVSNSKLSVEDYLIDYKRYKVAIIIKTVSKKGKIDYYIDNNFNLWKYAVPMTKDEINKYSLEEWWISIVNLRG